MLHDESTPNLVVRQRLLSLRVVHAALVAGVLIFAGVVWIVISGQTAPPPPTPAPTSPTGGQAVDLNLLRFVAGVLAFSALVMAIVIRQTIIRRFAQQEEKPTDETLINAYFTASLIGNAIAESSALLACVITLMSRNQPDLALVAAPLLLMLILTPTRGRWEGFRQRVLNDRALRAGRS